MFLTGSDRIPLLGMQQVKVKKHAEFVILKNLTNFFLFHMTIQPTSGGNNYFPVAHTCFNLLDLPKYEDENLCRSKLLEAIEHSQGFTLV